MQELCSLRVVEHFRTLCDGSSCYLQRFRLCSMKLGLSPFDQNATVVQKAQFAPYSSFEAKGVGSRQIPGLSGRGVGFWAAA